MSADMQFLLVLLAFVAGLAVYHVSVWYAERKRWRDQRTRELKDRAGRLGAPLDYILLNLIDRTK